MSHMPMSPTIVVWLDGRFLTAMYDMHSWHPG